MATASNAELQARCEELEDTVNALMETIQNLASLAQLRQLNLLNQSTITNLTERVSRVEDWKESHTNKHKVLR